MRIHHKKFAKVGLDILLAVGGIVFLLWYFAPPKEFFEKQFSFDLETAPRESIFRIFSGARLPKFTTAVIEPQDVKPGDIQKLTVGLEDPDGVVSVTAETELDRGINRLDLELVQGDEKSGYWTNAWIVRDTHSKIYRTKFIARDRLGRENSITLAWSDTCTSPYSGLWTIAATCSISGVDGADNGNIDIGGTFDITITAGATLVYNAGNQISLSTGRLIVNDTGQIKQANLFVTDNDNDGYANPNFSRTYSTAASLTNYVRRYTLATTPYDCDDTNSIVQINRTQRYDADADAYTVTGPSICASAASWSDAACSAAGSNYMKNSAGTCVIVGTLSGTDCYDFNANAKPGQTGWFTAVRGASPDSAGNTGSSYDYNCDSVETQQFGVTTGLCACNDSSTTQGYITSAPACGVSGTFQNGCVLSCNACCGSRSNDSFANYTNNQSARIQDCH